MKFLGHQLPVFFSSYTNTAPPDLTSCFLLQPLPPSNFLCISVLTAPLDSTATYRCWPGASGKINSRRSLSATGQ